MTTELVVALIFCGPILLGCAIWMLAVLNWPGFGRLGCKLGRHKLPKELEPLAVTLSAAAVQQHGAAGTYEPREQCIFVGECPRCGVRITRTVEGEWLEI